MNVFLTGAGGYIGSAVARSLIEAGHSVLGLTHTARRAGSLADAGVQPIIGNLKDPSGWARHAAACDALVHCAFEMGPDAPATDRAAIEALLKAARSADAARLLVYTSGVWVLGSSRTPLDESSPLRPLPIVAWRPSHEKLALDGAGGKLRTAVVRPGCVYGGKGGLFELLLKPLASQGAVRLIDGGANCWAVVHLDDLAELYLRLIEHGPETGVFHATDGSAEPLRDIAEAFLEAAGGGSLQPWPLDEAKVTLGPLADALALDQRVSSEKARRTLGWTPKYTSIIENADELFEDWKRAGARPVGS
jgi:nucleoside-diphosphate-sugar epimerase